MDMIEIACKRLREHPALLEDARRNAGWTTLGTILTATLQCSRAKAEHAVGELREKWGERVTAVVQLRPGQTVTEDEIRAFVKDRLGSVKAPKQVEVWPDLPRSKVGKVLKVEVKAQFL